MTSYEHRLRGYPVRTLSKNLPTYHQVDINRRFPRSEILQQSGMRLRSFCPENRMSCYGKVERFILPSGVVEQEVLSDATRWCRA
jgi:hypothetical protein